MGELGPKLVRGRFGLESGDLGHFAKLLGTRLKGALKLSADLEGNPAARELTAKIDAQTTDFASGVGLRRACGGTPRSCRFGEAPAAGLWLRQADARRRRM